MDSSGLASGLVAGFGFRVGWGMFGLPQTHQLASSCATACSGNVFYSHNISYNFLPRAAQSGLSFWEQGERGVYTRCMLDQAHGAPKWAPHVCIHQDPQ